MPFHPMTLVIWLLMNAIMLQQIPIEEFGNKNRNGRDEVQKKRFCWLNETIVSCMQMATVEQFKDSVSVPKDADYENNKRWYKHGDCFLAERKDGKGFFYVESVVRKNGELGLRC